MPKNKKIADLSAQPKSRAMFHTAHLMSEYLFSLSMMCKQYEWHKTGMHLCAGSDELKKMLDSGEITQKRYKTTL